MSTLDTLPNSYKNMVAKQEEKLNRAFSLATSLIAIHLPHDSDWHLHFHNRVRALGTCNYRTKRIGLSRAWTLATPWEEVEDTIRHEIAHAIAGHKAGHGSVWKKAARLVGAKPEATYKGGISAKNVHLVKYTMIDTTTGNILKEYYRKPTAKVYASLPYKYVVGRKAETLGLITINPVSIKELDL